MLAYEGVVLVPGAWLSEWSHKHPFNVAFTGGRHDHVSGDWAAQSCDRAGPGGPAHAAGASAPGVWRPLPGLMVCLAWPPGHVLSGLGVGGEQVVGAGQQLAGDSDGGDLDSPPTADGVIDIGESGGRNLAVWAALEDPAQPRRALLGDPTVVHGGVRVTDLGRHARPGSTACGRRGSGRYRRSRPPRSGRWTSRQPGSVLQHLPPEGRVWPAPGSAATKTAYRDAMVSMQTEQNLKDLPPQLRQFELDGSAGVPGLSHNAAGASIALDRPAPPGPESRTGCAGGPGRRGGARSSAAP